MKVFLNKSAEFEPIFADAIKLEDGDMLPCEHPYSTVIQLKTE